MSHLFPFNPIAHISLLILIGAEPFGVNIIYHNCEGKATEMGRKLLTHNTAVTNH